MLILEGPGSEVPPPQANLGPSLPWFLLVSSPDHMEPRWSFKLSEQAHFCEVPMRTPESVQPHEHVSASGPWHGLPLPSPLSGRHLPIALLTANSADLHGPQGSPSPGPSLQGNGCLRVPPLLLDAEGDTET